MNKVIDRPQAAKAIHQNIWAALAAAQADMGPVLKENVNPAYKSRYADLASVVAACLPALNAHGLSVYQPMREVDGKRYVVTIIAHESGETLENPVELLLGKSDMQGLGSAMTYARRYGLMAMAGVAPEDDDGQLAAASPAKQEHRQQARPQQSEPQRNQGPTAIEVAAGSLAGAETIDQLQAIWKGLPSSIRGEKPVIEAKEQAKARLSQPADLGGDEIPY